MSSLSFFNNREPLRDDKIKSLQHDGTEFIMGDFYKIQRDLLRSPTWNRKLDQTLDRRSELIKNILDARNKEIEEGDRIIIQDAENYMKNVFILLHFFLQIFNLKHEPMQINLKNLYATECHAHALIDMAIRSDSIILVQQHDLNRYILPCLLYKWHSPYLSCYYSTTD